MGTAFTTLVDALRQNRLLEAQQLSEVTQKLQKSFPEPRALMRELLRRGWLTPYQVNQLTQEGGQELLLGSYVLLERLGEGGMGQVFKARNWKLGQIVALKIIQPDRLANTNAVRRFQREIRAVASLNHPNIVRAIDADEVGGTHLLVMEYVEGTDLSQLVKKSGPLSIRKACDHIHQAALGLQHAHEQGLVHRDIKPANLLLASRGGNASESAIVKILDLGLARLEQGATGATATCLTQSGLVVGTPDFMAPEQVRDPHKADVRADLYSLGCSLYYLISGQVPFPGGSATEKVLQHMCEEPRPIEQLRPDVPAEVAAVIRKLMAKRPEDRYQTPAEAAAALKPLLAIGRTAAVKAKATVLPAPRARALPPQAIPLGSIRPDRPERPDRPRRSWPRVAGFAVLVLLAGIGVFWPLWSRSNAPSAKASRAERKDSPTTTVVERNDPVKVTIGRKEPPIAPTIPTPVETRINSPVERPEISAKDEMVVLGERRDKSQGAVFALAVTPDGRLLASGGADQIIHFWDATTWQKHPTTFRGHAGDIRALAIAPDGRLLASASADQTVRLWDLTTGRELASFAGHTGGARAVAFAPDSRMLASGAEGDPNVRLWDVPGLKERATWKAHEGGVLSLSFSPGDLTLATGGGDNQIRVWDLLSNEEQDVLKGHSGGIIALAHAPGGALLATGTRAGALRVWNPATRRLNSPRGGLSALAFSPDGRRLVSSDGKNQVILWDVESGNRLTERPFSSSIHSLAFCPNGYVAAGTDAGRIHVFRPDTLPAKDR